MANRYATKAGNWSDPTVWDGGTLPQTDDVVRPNNFIVDIDQDVEVSELRSNAAAPAVAGGYFRVASIPGTRNIVANLVAPGAAAHLIQVAAAGGTGTLNIDADIYGSTSSSNVGLLVLAVANFSALNVTGNLQPVASNGGTAMTVSSGSIIGSLTINGDLTHGAVSTSGHCLSLGGNVLEVATINGNVYSNAANTGTGVSLTGAANVLVVNGNVVSSGGTATGVITGAVVGSIVRVNQDVEASNSTSGVALTGANSYVIVSGNLRNAPNGRSAVFSPFISVAAGQPMTWDLTDDAPIGSGTSVVLTNQPVGGPSPEDVRAGLAYGAGNSLTGTLAVPPASSVAAGVPVDDTEGTASLDISQLAEVVGAQIAAAVSA